MAERVGFEPTVTSIKVLIILNLFFGYLGGY